jgi:hypothetical protein
MAGRVLLFTLMENNTRNTTKKTKKAGPRQGAEILFNRKFPIQENGSGVCILQIIFKILLKGLPFFGGGILCVD